MTAATAKFAEAWMDGNERYSNCLNPWKPLKWVGSPGVTYGRVRPSEPRTSVRNTDDRSTASVL
jgi:hypothetical protein